MSENINKESNFISAVVYVHNAEKSLEQFLNMLQTFLNHSYKKYEIICVNDASTDGSAELIRKFAENLEGTTISVLSMSYFQGLELSMDAGVDLSIGDFVYEFDSTVISYPADMMERVYRRCLEGFDIVAACPKDSGHRLSNVFYTIYNRNSSAQYPLRTEAFRILSRRSISRVQSMSKTIPYRKAIYANCGLPTDALYYEQEAPLPIARAEERANQKETATDALILYTNIAYQFAMRFSVLMMLITIGVAIYSLITYLTIHPVAGWTTTILFLSFCFFGISVLLTILVKYAALILKTVFTRQRYVVESIVKYGK